MNLFEQYIELNDTLKTLYSQRYQIEQNLNNLAQKWFDKVLAPALKGKYKYVEFGEASFILGNRNGNVQIAYRAVERDGTQYFMCRYVDFNKLEKMTEKLYNYLLKTFMRDNISKYHKYFGEWVENLTETQIVGFQHMMEVDESGVLK